MGRAGFEPASRSYCFGGHPFQSGPSPYGRPLTLPAQRDETEASPAPSNSDIDRIHNKPTDDPQGEDHSRMNWLYFILIGWWAGLLWFSVGLMLCATLLGIPPGMVMINKTPKIMFGE